MSEARAGRPGAFPTTMRSQVLAARSPDPADRARSFEVLTRAYYKPVYKYTRVRWRKPDDEAGEITHEFFIAAFEKGMFARYEPEKARFRTYLRLCLDRFISKRHRDSRAQKRGGGLPQLSLDLASVEREIERLPDEGVGNAEAYFEAEWIRYLLAASVDALRAHCEAKQKTAHFVLFERIDLCSDPGNRPSYADLAAEIGLSVSDVTNRLSWARRELRRIVLDTLSEITATEEELKSEALAVLGIRL
jgi:RNA polymerase sigma factor (sigma-70 family)